MNRLTTAIPANLEATQPGQAAPPQDRMRKHPRKALEVEPLLTADDVAKRLNVSTDWVWDHSSRKKPLLPVIRMGDGTLRYRQSGIEAFIDERERVSSMGRRAS
jgi:predicted DNA-binding transcriptional regulator AlpA